MTCPVCSGPVTREELRPDGSHVYRHPDGDFCVREQPRDRAARQAAIQDCERTPITTRLEAAIGEYRARTGRTPTRIVCDAQARNEYLAALDCTERWCNDDGHVLFGGIGGVPIDVADSLLFYNFKRLTRAFKV